MTGPTDPQRRTAAAPAPELPEAPSSGVRRGFYDAPALVTEFPPELPFGFLGKLLPTSLTAELRVEIHPVPPAEADELVHRASATAEAELGSGSGGIGGRPARLRREAESAEKLGESLAAREQELWRFGISAHGLGRTRGRAERTRETILRTLDRLGFRSRVPRYEVREVLRAPTLSGGEPRPEGYWHTLHTDGVAAFFPFVDELVAEPSGILVGLLLDDATPLLLDRWSHGSYSWGLFGATGSGKTFTAALWALRSRWMLPSLDLIVVDPLGEFAGLVRALGGTVVSLHSAAEGRVNPLDPITTGGDRDEKASRVTAMLGALFPSLRDEEVAELDATLRRLLDGSGPAPVFTDVLRELEARPAPGRLVQLLEVFRSGSLRHLDGPTTIAWEGSPLAFDLHGVPTQQMAFYLTFCLDAVAVRLRRRSGRKLVIVDEAHLLTRDPRTAEFLERMVRLVRHYDTGLLLLSQNPEDFLATPSGQALALNLRATTFLRVASVPQSTREFFHLTAAEAEWLPRARLPREAGYSEGLVRTGASHFPVAIVASTPEYDFLRQVLGAQPPASALEGAPPTARL